MKKKLMDFSQNVMLSKVKSSYLEANKLVINGVKKLIITEKKKKKIKKNFNKFFKSLMLSKVKFNDLEAISR